MPHSAVIRSASHQDVLNELRMFIGGATKNSKISPTDLTKTALSLLKTLPAARDAILEYFCSVLALISQNYIIRIETEIATGQLPEASEEDETIVSEIHTIFCNFVALNAEAWAPTISTWSLELLGEISTRYTGRAHVSTGVNETLQLWMSCRATRALIDITTQCLSCLIHSDTEACISALLDTSVKHSPHFDWVVAHVGSCFPTTVITRVLSCGLKDFCQNKSYEQGCNSPKLKSVVGILGHLAASHCDDIRIALIDLFNWSLTSSTFQEGETIKAQKNATVPFLLQLAYLSPTLLAALCADIKHTIPLDVIIQLYNFTDNWCKYFGSPESLEALLVSLIMKCEKGGVQIINILLNCIFNDDCQTNSFVLNTIRDNAREVLEDILQEMDLLLRTHQNTIQINLLDSLTQEVSDLEGFLLSQESIISQTAARIVIFIGHKHPSSLINSASYLFEHATTDEHLALLVRILTNELVDKSVEPYVNNGGHFAIVLERILSKYLQKLNTFDNCDRNLQMWRNLLTLLKWEKTEQVLLLKSQTISRAIHKNLISLTSLFGSNKISASIMHTLAEILEVLEIPSNDDYRIYTPPVQLILNFTIATVTYFFTSCTETDPAMQLKGCQRACKILKRLSLHSKVARVLALRELLERSIFSNEKLLFGAKADNLMHLNDEEKLLLEQNRKNSKIIPLTKHSSVFNGGIVGTGKRKRTKLNAISEDTIVKNKKHLIEAIKTCCSLSPESDVKNIDISLDNITLVSLLLVQFVSPDVMYNGLPWPEEEFSKVTIERDLFIRRLFNNIPLLWDLVSLVAVYRPALCYCSVLLRALAATLIHQWNSMGDQSKSTHTDNYKLLMNTTIKLIDVMALSQLLPIPLSGIRDVLPYLKCYEIVFILRDCVWSYMRDHVPSPALFTVDGNGLHWRDPALCRPPDVYINTLRLIMQKNIKTVGHLYSQMFINIPHDD